MVEGGGKFDGRDGRSEGGDREDSPTEKDSDEEPLDYGEGKEHVRLCS